MSVDTLEQTVVEGLIPELEADGYQVIRQPQRSLLPSFLQSYRPDLIALRPDRNLAIEIKAPGDRSTKDINRIAKLFEGRNDWEFKVYWLPGAGDEQPPQMQSIEDIDSALSEAEALASGARTGAGFLLAWAIFEALGRKILMQRFVRPQTPGRLIEVMANEGVLTPDEATEMRALVPLRNRLIHGELNVRLTSDQLGKLLSILRGLSAMAREAA